MPAAENNIYLTFDDGPHPEITPWILNELEKFGAKATFFCLGKNAEKYPEILEMIRQKGHNIGNHSYSHLDGWKTDDLAYFDDVKKADPFIRSKLFRPSYGKIKKSQLSMLNSQFLIFNWSLMPGDFDDSITSEKCFRNLADHHRPGDIVCLHDNEKARIHLEYCLPRWLEHFAEKNFHFRSLSEFHL
jgi:peptidoglycan/xylan/chitin deacetylase (PgdA/CDA1 family)